jgi:Ca2+-binding EF-hand superfamily protein
VNEAAAAGDNSSAGRGTSQFWWCSIRGNRAAFNFLLLHHCVSEEVVSGTSEAVMKSLRGILAAAALLVMVGGLRAEDALQPGEGVTQEQLKRQLLGKFDADGDGKLTGEELLKARDAVQNQIGAAAGVNLEELKKRFDWDGDGELNPQERAAAMAAIQKRRTGGGGAVAGGIPAGGGFGGNGPGGAPAAGEGKKSRSRDSFIKRFDRNGDGKLSEDEKAEAQKALKGKKGEKPASKLSEDLKKFDTDGDGTLSDEEKAEAKKARKEKGKKPE